MEQSGKAVSPPCPSNAEETKSIDADVKEAKDVKEVKDIVESCEHANSETGTKPKKQRKLPKRSLKRKSDVQNDEISNLLAEEKRKKESETSRNEHDNQAEQKEFQDQSAELKGANALINQLVKIIKQSGHKGLQKQLRECLDNNRYEEHGKEAHEKVKKLCDGMYHQIQIINSRCAESQKERDLLLEIIKVFNEIFKEGACRQNGSTQSEVHSFALMEDIMSLLNELKICKEDSLHGKEPMLRTCVRDFCQNIKSVWAQLNDYERVVQINELLESQAEENFELIHNLTFLLFGGEEVLFGL